MWMPKRSPGWTWIQLDVNKDSMYTWGRNRGREEWTCVRLSFNSLRPRPNRRHFADDIFKCIFENENEWISPKISLKFVPKVRIDNIPALVQIMAWRRAGDKPLSEPVMVSLLTHICVTRLQWVKCAPRWHQPLWDGVTQVFHDHSFDNKPHWFRSRPEDIVWTNDNHRLTTVYNQNQLSNSS